MPTEVDIDDRDETATDAAAIVRRLNKVIAIQQRANKRLELIAPNVPNPGPPELPTLVSSIVTEAQKTITLAQGMLRS